MTSPQDFLGFWETTGSAKTFTHPLDPALLDAYVPRGAHVLDYGCGYGRLTAELAGLGYRAVRGVDVSAALIARGRREHPELDLLRWAGFPLPFEDGAFDAALLFAVLTCVPGDADQTAIAGELGRLVRPGGVLYLSDVPLQDDALNQERYARFAERYGTYGVFETPDGGVFRHHPPERLRGLVRAAGFSVLAERRGSVGTLDGRTAERLQLVARREPTETAEGG
ncbi:ubiquinone/menaquinone biosynthesis C-methylase UbiE [Streptomyces sp. 2333.5]|uniref:class I SAM-dependent methyltransferase n=1 Tax=Streptomyces TaxID=1883 RepID=UPI00089948E4|nr:MULTISPECIES: class I SAM-dependent methyltransferase [unclassified Streptomyces]PJJ01240.1 ubiquinone/menaquinone biosynthesis C-methylase UbiE [Streptomyces sp. 2333.5]SEC49227.1 Ubiquinone/menaquinone biosynthesis C-methylase UbiE [Streptomyces sp. 2314.4]SED28065.1 Ubiquinone/menaquinone biosynthesis C-methylase UbiE [Streptomyces sp. 2112.2]SOE14502.1 Ubiquinone/menaquinone biosynthesis C-methylase UbiE [Streptomyces sp. 2323.1]